MLSATFIGEVHQGRVDVSVEFEGKRVKVTLTVEDAPASAEATASTPPLVVSEEAEMLEDCGRICLPPSDVTTVKFRFVDVGPQPMRVYAEEECEVWED